MPKKYELTTDTKIHFGRKLFRIKALVDFGDVKAGDLGGYVEKEGNLSHNGNAWVCEDAVVYGDAVVRENAVVYGDAKVCGDAVVCENAVVYGDAVVYENAVVRGNAVVCENAVVRGDADYLCFKGLGSHNRNTTFYKTKDGGVSVVCGCFNGTLGEFTAKVKETHGDSKYAREYLAAVEVVKIHFELEE